MSDQEELGGGKVTHGQFSLWVYTLPSACGLCWPPPTIPGSPSVATAPLCEPYCLLVIKNLGFYFFFFFKEGLFNFIYIFTINLFILIGG